MYHDTHTNTQEDVGPSEEEFMEEDKEERDKDAVTEEDILSQVGPFQVPQHHEIITHCIAVRSWRMSPGRANLCQLPLFDIAILKSDSV